MALEPKLRALVLAAHLSACCRPGAEEPGSFASRPARGDPADVHVAAGDCDGYRVVRPCPLDLPREHEIGVDGTGSGCAGGPCREPRQQEAAERFLAELRAVHPTWWSGWSTAHARCTPGHRFAIGISLYDWRMVDEVVREVGERLGRDGLGDEVVAAVAGDPERY